MPVRGNVHRGGEARRKAGIAAGRFAAPWEAGFSGGTLWASFDLWMIPAHIPRLMLLSILIPLLLAILVIVCLLLTLVVLMQRPKSEGLGAAFGSGMTENIFGAQTSSVLTKATVYLGGIFFLITLLLTVLTARQGTTRREGLLEGEARSAAALPSPMASTPPVAGPSASAGTTPLALSGPTPGATPAATAGAEPAAGAAASASVAPEASAAAPAVSVAPSLGAAATPAA
ncbi:MAG TPA: preprotein translocase subunit SecG, partial [Chthoniobacterales bacterium]